MPAVCPIGGISLSPSARTAIRCSCERASSDICIYMILKSTCFSRLGGVAGDPIKTNGAVTGSAIGSARKIF